MVTLAWSPNARAAVTDPPLTASESKMTRRPPRRFRIAAVQIDHDGPFYRSHISVLMV